MLYRESISIVFLVRQSCKFVLTKLPIFCQVRRPADEPEYISEPRMLVDHLLRSVSSLIFSHNDSFSGGDGGWQFPGPASGVSWPRGGGKGAGKSGRAVTMDLGPPDGGYGGRRGSDGSVSSYLGAAREQQTAPETWFYPESADTGTGSGSGTDSVRLTKEGSGRLSAGRMEVATDRSTDRPTEDQHRNQQGSFGAEAPASTSPAGRGGRRRRGEDCAEQAKAQLAFYDRQIEELEQRVAGAMEETGGGRASSGTTSASPSRASAPPSRGGGDERNYSGADHAQKSQRNNSPFLFYGEEGSSPGDEEDTSRNRTGGWERFDRLSNEHDPSRFGIADRIKRGRQQARSPIVQQVRSSGGPRQQGPLRSPMRTAVPQPQQRSSPIVNRSGPPPRKDFSANDPTRNNPNSPAPSRGAPPRGAPAPPRGAPGRTSSRPASPMLFMAEPEGPHVVVHEPGPRPGAPRRGAPPRGDPPRSDPRGDVPRANEDGAAQFRRRASQAENSGIPAKLAFYSEGIPDTDADNVPRANEDGAVLFMAEPQADDFLSNEADDQFANNNPYAPTAPPKTGDDKDSPSYPHRVAKLIPDDKRALIDHLGTRFRVPGCSRGDGYLGREDWGQRLYDLEMQIEQKNKVILQILNEDSATTGEVGAAADEVGPGGRVGVNKEGLPLDCDLNKALAGAVHEVMDKNVHEWLSVEFQKAAGKTTRKEFAAIKDALADLEEQERVNKLHTMMHELMEVGGGEGFSTKPSPQWAAARAWWRNPGGYIKIRMETFSSSSYRRS